MGSDISDLLSLNQALLVDRQLIVSFLKQRVKPIKDGWVAKIRILEDRPATLLDLLHKH
jgi:hypothetical protein